MLCSCWHKESCLPAPHLCRHIPYLLVSCLRLQVCTAHVARSLLPGVGLEGAVSVLDLQWQKYVYVWNAVVLNTASVYEPRSEQDVSSFWVTVSTPTDVNRHGNSRWSRDLCWQRHILL